jgi:hypothetical protein
MVLMITSNKIILVFNSNRIRKSSYQIDIHMRSPSNYYLVA